MASIPAASRGGGVIVSLVHQYNNAIIIFFLTSLNTKIRVINSKDHAMMMLRGVW